MPCCNAELVEQVKQAMEEAGLKQAPAAKAIGMSEGTLSAILNAKYSVDNIQPMEEKLRAWLDKTQKRKAEYKPLYIKFVPTSVSEYVFNMAESCRVHKEMAICVGKAGIGKTTSIREYAKRHSDVIVIYANSCMTKHGLFEELAEALNLNSSGSTNVLFRRCKNRLHNGDVCIIVDEAEHLSIDTLDDLRRVADPEVGGCGLLLVGLPQFLANLKSYKSKTEYLTSRFYQKTVREFKDKGVQDICAAAGEVYAPWYKQFAKYTHNARRLVKALNMCLRIMCQTEASSGEPCPMSEDVIATAFEQLVF